MAGHDGAGGVGGGGLGGRVEGGLDGDVAAPRAAEIRVVGGQPVEEVLRALGGGGAPHLGLLGQGSGAVRLADRAGLRHCGEHQRRALRGSLGLFGGIVVGGRLGDGGQDRRLLQGEARGRLVEIAPRRRLDAIGAGAEIDAAEIQAEDLLLGVGLLQLGGQQQLLALALQGALGGQVEVAGQLLGDGRAALGDAAGPRSVMTARAMLIGSKPAWE